MIDNFESRDAVRIEHISQLTVKDIGSGEKYEARMFNYSHSGIYFESDGIFEKGATIYIGIQNSPYSLSSGVSEYFYGVVMWQKKLKRSFFNYGYGIQLVSESNDQNSDSTDTKLINELRKHPRKSFSRKIQFGTHKGIFQGTTKNISASGVFVSTDEKLEVGQLLKLHLPRKKGKIVKAIGRIVWINDEGFGLKFIKIA